MTDLTAVKTRKVTIRNSAAKLVICKFAELNLVVYDVDSYDSVAYI